MRKSSLAGFGVLLLANACSLLFPVPDGSEDASVGTPGADGSNDLADARTIEDGGDGGGPSIRCPEDVRGPKLVPVDTYCIDRRKVTVAEYQAFQDAGVSLDAQPPGCETNPAYQLLPLLDGGAPPPDTAALVDWCEAYVYCRWAGKRLCSAVDGGPLAYDDYSGIRDRRKNAWLHACTGPDGTVYPYGNDFEPDACVAGRPVEQPECQGGYPGIFDLASGSEWLDSCRDAGCIVMNGPACRDFSGRIRVSAERQGALAGIRCCSP